MNSYQNQHDVKRALRLLGEYLETIRINIEILQMLHQNGRINHADSQYLEIIELDRKNRKSFQELVIAELPDIIKAEHDPESRLLIKSLLDWAADLNLSLGYLDRITKEYMHQLITADKQLSKDPREPDIRDKRFWKFLENAKVKTRLFDSFDENESPGGSDQVVDPVESKGKQQREEE